MSSRPSNSGSNSVSDGKLRESQQASITRAGGSSVANSTVLVNAKSSASQGLGLDTTPKIRVQAPDITQGRHRRFMVGVAIAQFVSHLPFLVLLIIYMVKRDQANPFLFSFYQGDPKMYLTYAIICTVIVLLILIVPSFVPAAGRGALGYPLYGLFWLCSFYAIMYGFTKQSQGRYLFESDMTLLPITMAFLYASFGTVVTAALSVRKVPKVVAIAFGAGGVLLSMILFAFVAKITSPQIWQTGLFIALGAFLGFYYAFDLEDMVLKRGTYYRTDDWFLGFVHLNTDLFFRLPRDVFLRRSQPQEVVQELEIAEPDAELK